MDYDRIADLYTKLAAEQKKVPIDKKRVDEINYWISREFAGKPPVAAEGSLWKYLDKVGTIFYPLPANWKIYVTSAIGAFVAFNSQTHLVPPDWQNALLAAAISLGFWAVNSTQNLNYEKMKTHLASIRKN